MSSKDINDEHIMHSKSDSIEITVNDTVDEVIEELFQSIISMHQIELKTLIKSSGFIFDCIHLLY